MSDGSAGLGNPDTGDLSHRRVLEALADAIVVADKETQTIVYANQAIADLLGWQPFELLGMEIQQLVPPRLREAHQSGFDRFVETGERRLMGRTSRLPAMRRDGMEVEVELTLSEAAGTGLIVAGFRDVTQRVELERQLAFVVQLQDTTALASRLSATTDIDAITALVADSMLKSFDAAGAEVWQLQDSGEALWLTGTAGIAREPGMVLDLRERSLVAQAATSQHPVILNLVPEEGIAETAEARMYGFDAQAVLPLTAGGKLRGVLRATFRQRLSLDQTELLTTMSALVASAMETALLMRLEQEARAGAEANQRRLGFLAEASAALARSLDENSILTTIGSVAIGQLADLCVVHLALPSGDSRVAAIAAADGDLERAARDIVERGPGRDIYPAGSTVVQSGQATLHSEITDTDLVANAADDDHLARLRALQLRSAMVVPLAIGGRCLGAVLLGRGFHRDPFTGADLDLAGELGRRAALTLDSARLHGAVEVAHNRLTSIVEGMGAVMWEADSTTFDFTFVSRQAEQILGYPVERWFERNFLGGIVHPDDLDRVTQAFRGSAVDDDEVEIECRMLTSDGSHRWVRNHVFFERRDGRLAGVRGLMSDITAVHATQEAADFSMALLESQSDASIDGIAVVATDGSIAWSNRRFRELWGFSGGDVAGRFRDTVDHVGALAAHPDAYLRRATWLLEHPNESGRDEVTLADGRILDRYVTPLHSERGTLSGQAWYFRDVTAERRAQREIYESRERFASLARSLQRSLLPPLAPTIPGLEVGTIYRQIGDVSEVGGDFYDLFQAGDGTWAVVLGDVCGRGPEAASLTALTRYSVRAAGLGQAPPEAVLRTVNEAILRDEPGELYCTAVYALVRPGTPGVAVELSCAGHPSPLLLTAAGHVREVGRHGTLLGVLQQPDLATDLVVLDPGDSLLLYTHGVLEARWGNDQFGAERLKAVLAACRGQSAQQIVAHVEQAVLRYTGGHLADGVALLALSVPGDATATA